MLPTCMHLLVSGRLVVSFGSIIVSTCCLEEFPGDGLLGTVLLVGYFWLCQNSSIDPASGVSLRCSPSDPLFLFRFPRVSFKASICCLEEVPGVGLCGVLLLFGFRWRCHTSPVDAIWVWRLCVPSSIAVGDVVTSLVVVGREYSSSDPPFLFRFPGFFINISTCCLEEVPGVGLWGTLSLVGFLWL